MPAPSNQEYATASAAVYNIQSGFTPPSGWTVVATSPAGAQSDGFAAVALKDPSGNIIIANEGTACGTTSYCLGTLSADTKIINGQSPQAMNDAVQFAQTVLAADTTGAPIYVTGHSLGGAAAEAECQSLGSQCSGGVSTCIQL